MVIQVVITTCIKAYEAFPVLKPPARGPNPPPPCSSTSLPCLAPLLLILLLNPRQHGYGIHQLPSTNSASITRFIMSS